MSSTVAGAPLLVVENMTKEFPAQRRFLAGKASRPLLAVDHVSFSATRGETFGIVGESGCGKSTLTRAILRLIEPTSGHAYFDGIDLGSLDATALRAIRSRLQVVFQDPFSSLDPRMSIRDIVAEGLEIHGDGDRSECRLRAAEMLELVGIPPAVHGNRPDAFSGGQRQRVGVARALAMRPELVFLDEPISALDVSIQAQVLNLLRRLQLELGLTYVFIVHDLAIAEYFCDRVAVLYRGSIVETGARAQLFEAPLHPYTVALLSAVPEPDPKRSRHRQRIVLQGDVAPVHSDTVGCRFRARCPVGKDRALCATLSPPLQERVDAHQVACHFPGELRVSP